MIPVFGITAARDWLWFLTLSPAFTAWGIVLDLSVACSMLLGAILGWAILSPLARNSGWAPGPIDSMETGVRGWLVWVSIGLLLGDATIRVLHETAGFTQRLNLSIRTPKSRNTSRIDRNQEDPSLQHLIEERTGSNGGMDTTSSSKRQNQQNHLVSSKAMLCWLLGSTSLCVISTWVVFQQEIRVYFVITAVAIGFPLCLIVIQSAGETDAVPSSGLSEFPCTEYHRRYHAKFQRQRLSIPVWSHNIEVLYENACLDDSGRRSRSQSLAVSSAHERSQNSLPGTSVSQSHVPCAAPWICGGSFHCQWDLPHFHSCI